MPLNTILLEFKVDIGLSAFSNEAGNGVHIAQMFGQQLKKYKFSAVFTLPSDPGPKTGTITMLFVRPDGCQATLRCQPGGLVTLDIHEAVEEGEIQPVFTQEVVAALEESVKVNLECKKSFNLPAVKRGFNLNPYYPTVDNLFIEYDFEKTLFEEDSPFQNVKICQSKQFGAVLILDNDVNLAESDILYTKAITGLGKEDYAEKTVLILGGGDGGILHTLQSQDRRPAFITMIDIDEAVVRGARKHMRKTCGDSMDELKGDNYEIILADCVPKLENYVKEGVTFDFVINDLTAIPVSTEAIGDHWDFLRKILDFSMMVMKDDGKYYTQGNSVNVPASLNMYEQQLKKLKSSVAFHTETVFVPSYHEAWVFYEIWKT